MKNTIFEEKNVNTYNRVTKEMEEIAEHNGIEFNPDISRTLCETISGTPKWTIRDTNGKTLGYCEWDGRFEHIMLLVKTEVVKRLRDFGSRKKGASS